MTVNGWLWLANKFLWFVSSPRLEEKAWFRFIKVLQGLAILIVICAALITLYGTYSQQSLVSATLKCNDGTTWNAIDTKASYGNYKTERDIDDMCGICTQRMKDNTFRKCSYESGSAQRYDSYIIVREYKKDNSIILVVWYTSLVLFIGLFVVNIAARVLIYLFGGGKK